MHIDLKQYGITWQEIADELGVSVSTPRVWVVRGEPHQRKKLMDTINTLIDRKGDIWFTDICCECGSEKDNVYESGSWLCEDCMREMALRLEVIS